MKKIITIFLFLNIAVFAQNSREIKSTGIINVYFNKSVDTTVAISEKAKGEVNLAQKLINRIDSAKYSVDLCVYSFSGTPGPGDDIATALINAKSRGVKVRFIIEDDNSSTAPVRRLSSAGIPVLTDKVGINSGNGLQHNKFFIFDNRNNSSETDDWVISGSWNPTQPGTFDDWQNIVEIQDKSFADAFTIEFNEMWGGSGDNYDANNAKFSVNKTDNTPHNFNIGGVPVELYFSPTDRTVTHIVEKVNSAKYSINFSEMTFTNDDAYNAIKNANTNKKVTVRGVMDAGNITASGTKYPDFIASPKWCTVLKSVYPVGIYHHKYIIIDGDNPYSDSAWVLTGSYNITNAAEYTNNENLMFFKSKRIANLYLQEFVKRFNECGGIFTSVNNSSSLPGGYSLSQNYPNPFNPETRINYSIVSQGKVNLKIYDILGREIQTLVNEIKPSGNYSVTWTPKSATGEIASGIYYYSLITGKYTETRKMIYMR
jgi:phosphatidylserine/phosphatidylglycerophosphate/cardiolipin synthase-like enzyme